ncbi:uncharacterized protein MalAC0309_1996 [Microcella alkaliphila]|uniref:Uncharacterized protein n=1 Tax=Microcella alkaliphila TaxID=279828 RepID=A0A0U5BAR1_9MICO|nr:uncharacterized protein MalAC0309_1996 [Microcella alkaliphila]
MQEGVALGGERGETAGDLAFGAVGDHPSFGLVAGDLGKPLVLVSEGDQAARLNARRSSRFAHDAPDLSSSPSDQAGRKKGTLVLWPVRG